ncbi:MAG: carboxypeptidase regulatory-like domain-containing protein [Euryarchaeota archaeon]|nr:carboxypeptidase regulatory-like domain-containing protein [Euryarchaeota archaeon]
MRTLPLIAASIVAWVAFAGCVGQGEGASDRTGQPDARSGPVDFDDTTGAIEGTVTTPELDPIPAAQVGLRSDSLPEPVTASTDESGRFVLNRLAPGQYRMDVQALGFQAQARAIEVTAGKAETLSFILEPLPTDDPYQRTIHESLQMSSLMYKATPSCLYLSGYVPPGIPVVSENANLLKTCGGVRFGTTGAAGYNVTTGCDACESHTQTNKKYSEFNANWSSILGEVTWKAQTGATGRGFLFDINAPNITRGTGGSIDQASPYTWYKGTNKPPIILRIDKPTTLEERKIPASDWNNYPENDCTAPGPSGTPNCDWFWRMFAAACDLGICNDGFGPDYGLMLQGRADVYFTFAVRQPLSQDFTALPDE